MPIHNPTVIEKDGMLATISRDGRLWLDCYIDTFRGINIAKAHADGYPAGCHFAHYGAGFSDSLRVPFGVTRDEVEAACRGRYRNKGNSWIKLYFPTRENSESCSSGIFQVARDGIHREIWGYSSTEIPVWADALTESEYQFLLERIERYKAHKASKGT